MPDTPSITIVHRFSYRAVPEEWSNTYHFSGTVPTNAAGWKTLADAFINIEKPIHHPDQLFVRAYGYEAGNENSVAQIDYTVPPLTPAAGTTSIGAADRAPGDVAATVRWWTGETSTRGKKVYCRKYLHGQKMSSVDWDNLDAAHAALLATWAGKLIDGTLPGGVKYCGPQGAVLSAPTVSPYLTTRTLKRRGRRPPS